MRILVISHEFPPIGGGGANACYYITREFVGRGHMVVLITSQYGDLPEKESINGVRVIRVRSRRKNKEHCGFFEMTDFLCKAYQKADQLLKQEKFDICNIYFGIPSGPVGFLLKKKYGLPYVIRFGGGDIPGFQERFQMVYRIIAPFLRIIWKNADALVANSGGLKKLAEEFYNRKKIDVICNGVDTVQYYPVKKEEREECRILFASRLIERKGLQFIIPELKRIEEKSGKKVRLIVAGDGPYREVLEAISRQCSVEDKVYFVGQQDKNNLVKFYQNTDLFILPSKKEGMPNVVLEAMACGLPVVMTPCQGSEEMIIGNGVISPIDSFAEVVADVIADQERRSVMAEKSRVIACERFSWEHTSLCYLKLFEQLTKKI